MEWSSWFEYQLGSTLEGFIWAVQRVQKERLFLAPPVELGEWSASQHIAHMLEYEEFLALPSMYQWLGAPPAARREKDDTQNPISIEEMLAGFQQVRKKEIGLLREFDEGSWNSSRQTTFWGEVSLLWLVSKTYQHTLEHTHDVMRMSLFWDRIITRRKQY